MIERCVVCGGLINQFIKNGKDYEYGVKGNFNFKRCLNCGLLSISPFPSAADLVNYYPPSYHCYNTPSSIITRTLAYYSLRRQAHLFKKLIGIQGKILDVGCADGGQFYILRKFGEWQFVGIDINEKMVQVGKSKGRDLYLSTLENFKGEQGSFDLIVMDHLLEHVIDPNNTLKAAIRLLKRGGYIIGATPNSKSLDAYLFKRYWGGNHFPRHTYLFSPKNLRLLFKNNGLTFDRVGYELHTGHWALSVQNFFQSKKIFKTKLTNGRAFYYPILLLIFLPFNALQKLLHITGIISFIAIKE